MDDSENATAMLRLQFFDVDEEHASGSTPLLRLEEIHTSQRLPNKPAKSTSSPGNVFWAVVHWLMPSPLQESSRRKLYPTSYLDGLRGVAAFIVYIDHFRDHFATAWMEPLRRGYGSTSADNYILQLPIIRLLYSGRASVAVFFVISGFVLSYKPLKQIHSGQYVPLLDTLASSVFRRVLQLYLPVAAGIFFAMLMAHWGWYYELPISSTDVMPPVYENLLNQTKHWYHQTIRVSWPLQEVNPDFPYSPPYNGHLWTIPIEFYGSMVVFALVLCLCRCRTGYRLFLMGLITLSCLHYERWDVFLFVSGMLVAELNLLGDMVLTRDWGWMLKSWGFSGSSVTSILNYTLGALSLYLISYPGGADQIDEAGPGFWYEHLIAWTPRRYVEMWWGFERFWVSLGGVLLVFSISRSTKLQRQFTTRVAQYMGDISYALYIVHGPFLFTLGAWLMKLHDGERSGWLYVVCFITMALVHTLLCLWMADLFWRGVDTKSVVFAKWLAGKCWVNE